MTSTTAPIPATPTRRTRRRPRRSDTRVIKYVLLLVFVLIILMPVYILLVTSFKGLAETDPGHAWSLPNHWSLSGWRDAWTSLSPALGNSFKLVIPATLISTVLGSLNGFVLSKWRFPGADVVFTFFLFGLFIPYQAVMIPLTQLFEDVQFPDGIPRLVFAHVVYGIPITTLIFRNYYATINLLAAVRCTRAAAPHLLKTQGHVVNIASLAAKAASRFLGAYPASKFALAAYSQQLRLELGPQGLHVLLVCPGPLASQQRRTYGAESDPNLPPEATQPGGGVKTKLIPPADLAARILSACQRRRPELVLPGKARLLFAIAQLWPSAGDYLLRKFT